MSDLRLTCLSPEARELVLSEMRYIRGDKTQEAFQKMINEIPQCPIGQSVGVATGRWTWRDVRGTARKSNRRRGWLK